MAKSNQKIYAFIDSQNINIGVRKLGWELDFGKFRLYLKNKYGVSKTYLFIGYIKENAALYKRLQEFGYILIFKPVLEIKQKGKSSYKGNVDAELVLHAMIQKESYDKAVIASGDGDFHCLIEHLESEKLLSKIVVPNKRYSSLLRKYSSYIMSISTLRKKLESKKKEERHSRRE